MIRRTLGLLLVAALLATPEPAAAHPDKHPGQHRPIVFVHGSAGMDVYLPARGCTVVTVQERGTGALTVLPIPAWPSTGHRSTVNL